MHSSATPHENVCNRIPAARIIGMGLWGLLSAFVLFTLIACGKPELDRVEAKRLLESHVTISNFITRVPMHDDALDLGKKLQWWQYRTGFMPTNFRPELSREFVKFHDGDISRSYYSMELANDVTSSISIDIEVTGITTGVKEDTRVIEYLWKYSRLPSLTSFIAVEGGSGKAFAQLYDNGWRIGEGFSLLPSTKKPYALTPEQEAYKVSTIANIEAARKSSAEARAQQIAEFNELVRRARISNDIQKTISFPGGQSWCCQLEVTVTIFNGGVTVAHQEVRNGGEKRIISTRSMLFSDMPKISDDLPAVAAFKDGGMYLGGIQAVLRTSPDMLKAGPHVDALNAVNKTFAKWLNESGLYGKCPRSRKWGCDMLAG